LARRVAKLLLAGAVLAASCGGSDDAFPDPVPTVDVALREYGFDYKAELDSGRTVFRVRNTGTRQHQLVLIYLPPEIPSLEAQLRSSERQVVPTIVSLPPRDPGRSGTFAVDLDPGRYGFVCFVEDADGVQHVHKGMSSELRIA
jgi:hypothetical protein